MLLLYGFDAVARAITSGIQLNSDALTFKDCYNVCANKQKIEFLRCNLNQIIYGRRGTGKTTLLKAFTYAVNNNGCNFVPFHFDKEQAFYCQMDRYVSSREVQAVNKTKDRAYLCIVKLLKDLNEWFINYATNATVSPYDENKIIDTLSLLDELINIGNRKISKTEECGKIETTSNTVLKSEFGGHVSLSTSKLRFSGEHKRKSSTKNKRIFSFEADYILDLEEISKCIETIIALLGWKRLYICIDEFTTIDIGVGYTIQPYVAQLLKYLFFKSPHITVKIASVWSMSRMQQRQVNGIRQGLELGQDIFESDELTLDSMFSHCNDDAKHFFNTLLVNYYLMGRSKQDNSPLNSGAQLRDCFSSNEDETFHGQLLNILFENESFLYLVCGSQGVPRLFGELLTRCISKTKSRKLPRINPTVVFESIISDYTVNVRQRVQYSSRIFIKIENYVSQKRHRFFLVKMEDYNRALNYFDGFTATAVIHQCTSEQLPRSIRNSYKLFYVHYGNYLESLHEKGLKNFYETASSADKELYPPLPENILDTINDYVMEIDDLDVDDFYCPICRKHFSLKGDIKKPHSEYIKCPECNSTVEFWPLHAEIS
ncbi:ORC-CDC6 family AAA ATPase [Faecalibacterium duncaniae]